MKITNATMSDSDIAENETARDVYRIKSSLKCLRGTNGIRPGEFSVLLGASGNGKSTFCRTISFECAVQHVKTLHILSEEKTAVYKSPLFEKIKNFAKPGTEEIYMKNLLFTSMLDWESKSKNPESFFSKLEEIINEHLPELIILDNFTTSFFNDLHVSQQGKIIDSFRRMAAAYDIAIFAVFHTVKGTDIYKKLITGEDVRGNATSTNGGSYVYTIQNFFRAKPETASILTVEKARYHPNMNQTFWHLLYEKDSGLYTGDFQIDYDALIEIQKSANTVVKKGVPSWR